MGWAGSMLLLSDVHLEFLFVEGSTKGAPTEASSLTAVPCLALKPSSDQTEVYVCVSVCMHVVIIKQVSYSVFLLCVF